MPKVTGNIVEDFQNHSQEQQAELLRKLRKYVERGEWAADMLAKIALLPKTP